MAKTIKTIDTLVQDILELFDGEHIFADDRDKHFAHQFADQVLSRMGPQEERTPSVRMSNIGQPCTRKLWYELNESDSKEDLPPDVRLKFLFGDMYEEFLLFLAVEAGHTVEGRQTEMDVQGVKGHRDCVIDGVVVDVKSASGFGFKKFNEGNLKYDDAFGYIPQLQLYLHASQDDPVVTDKERCAFFVVDKSTGEICLDIHKRDTRTNWDAYVDQKVKDATNTSDIPPREFTDVPQYTKKGQPDSKNRKLGVNCRYCNFKKICWPQLRTFLYGKDSNQYEVHLTVVENEPRVPEVK